jgi:hypothetical protein
MIIVTGAETLAWAGRRSGTLTCTFFLLACNMQAHARFLAWQRQVLSGKNSIIMNNPYLILMKSILTKNDAITQQKRTSHILRNYSFLRSELTNASKK